MHEAVTHKYEAGQVAIIVGTYPGAALLAAKAAFRTGAGIVRLFSQEPITPLFPEVIAHPLAHLPSELHRTKALLINSSLPIPETSCPRIIDGEALTYFSGTNAILTPHAAECKRLTDNLQRFVDQHSVILVSKGPPVTRIYRPHAEPKEIRYENRNLSTAGTGDVLAGIIAALVAQGLELEEAAYRAVVMHHLAADQYPYKKGMMASDLIDAIPRVMNS